MYDWENELNKTLEKWRLRYLIGIVIYFIVILSGIFIICLYGILNG